MSGFDHRHVQQRPGDPPAGIASAYADFVRNYDWDVIGTLTFARNISPERAKSALDRLIQWVNRRTFGNNYFKRNQGVRWVAGLERQADGRPHFHLLVHGCADRVSASDIQAKWNQLAGDAKVETYDRKRAGSHYVVKSAAFDGDIVLGGVWPNSSSATTGSLT